MGFDSRSLERLRQLGRTLPKPLPPPEPAAPARSTATPATDRRHRVETETDPDALFRELMRVSPDGNVPPHLLDRLRDAEATRRLQRRAQRLSSADPRLPANPPTTSGSAAAVSPSRQGAGRPLSAVPSRGRGRDGRNSRGAFASADEEELYSAFQQLLLEEDDPA
jgi:hypothetical protein